MNTHAAQTDLPSSEAPPHALPGPTVAERFEVDPAGGLSTEQVKARRRKHGPNRLRETPPAPLWRRFARQLRSLLVAILIAAALVSGLVGEWPETIAILAIVLLNAVIGFIQEERAERALAALRKLSAPTCRVTRDGRPRVLAAEELVPGDLIHVEAGDQVPADARLIHAVRLSTQEAALTGESAPVWKDAAAVVSRGTPLADRRNMLHAGTSVATGKGSAIVIATGMDTELGRIAGLLERTDGEPTPLQHRLAVLGRYLVIACVLLVAVIFVLNVSRGHKPLEVFLLSVSLAVAAVPEGLPAVVTIALALGVHRMARRNALVRNLPAVETLGCVTVICSDKTGTLTRNEMTVREVWTPAAPFLVSGVGYAPVGEFRRKNIEPSTGSTEGRPVDPQSLPDLAKVITIGALCNNAVLHQEPDGSWQVLGDPTEAALRTLAAKATIDVTGAERIHEIPFDSDRKAMSVIVRDRDGDVIMCTKGAAEAILPRCTAVLREGQITPLTHDLAASARTAAEEMGRRALRVLAAAYRPVTEPDPHSAEEAGLILAGLVGMIDPPREEARAAVQRCRGAGIRPVMITGDHSETALAVARDLELSQESDGAIVGPELDEVPEDALADRIEQIAVFARVSAEHKLRIVRALRSRGHVAAMTGDGVNDAAAVKAADIGIAMGRTGTDVTRSAADMILLDDNFASIVAAVEEGRGIFDNIQKVTHYLLSCNVGELVLLFFAALAGWPAPLVAAQILWINLITDGLPALALGVEPPEGDVMRRLPRRPQEPLITGRDALSILWHGVLIAAVAAAGFAWLMWWQEAPLGEARAAAFSITAFAQLFFALGCRSRNLTMPQIGWLTNPALFWAIAASAAIQIAVTNLSVFQALLRTEALTLQHWALVLLLSLVPVTLVESWKLFASARADMRRP